MKHEQQILNDSGVGNTPDLKMEKREQTLAGRIVERAREIYPEMLKDYIAIHENPELGGEEFETAARVKLHLESLGIEILGEGIGGTGIVAKIKGKESGSIVALRADMDALPMEENPVNEPRSKKNGMMHGCGHDLHTAGLMGAARILKELADEGALKGEVVLLFQPSEEKAHQKKPGSVPMIAFLERNGLRDDIRAFFGLHVFGMAEKGTILTREGVFMASSGEMDIELHGPGGHIMNSYESPDLNRVFSQITLELQERFRPLFEKNEAVINTRGPEYSSGGYNVMPASGKSTWVIRIASPDFKKMSQSVASEIRQVTDEVISRHLEELERMDPTGSAVNKEITVEFKRRDGYRPVVHHDAELVGLAVRSAREVMGDNAKQDDALIMGGEDFSFYLEELQSKRIPGVYMGIGGASPDSGYPKVDHHSPNFRIDPEALKDLAEAYSILALNGINHYNSSSSMRPEGGSTGEAVI
ncbi:MAG: amidohydrolase [Candidatus Moraniibacteriota bacterium]